MDETKALRVAAVVYAVTIAVHTADHLRRGTDASPDAVIMLGSVGIALQLTAIALAVARNALAPVAALLVGAGSALGVVVVHLLPGWNATFTDSFPDNAPGVTAYSWVTAIVEAAAAVAFAWLGARALRRARETAATTPA